MLLLLAPSEPFRGVASGRRGVAVDEEACRCTPAYRTGAGDPVAEDDEIDARLAIFLEFVERFRFPAAMPYLEDSGDDRFCCCGLLLFREKESIVLLLLNDGEPGLEAAPIPDSLFSLATGIWDGDPAGPTNPPAASAPARMVLFVINEEAPGDSSISMDRSGTGDMKVCRCPVTAVGGVESEADECDLLIRRIVGVGLSCCC